MAGAKGKKLEHDYSEYDRHEHLGRHAVAFQFSSHRGSLLPRPRVLGYLIRQHYAAAFPERA